MRAYTFVLVLVKICLYILTMSTFKVREVHGLRCLHANIHASQEHQRRIIQEAVKSYQFHVIAFLDPYFQTREKLSKLNGYKIALMSKTDMSYVMYVRKDIGLEAYRPVDTICGCEGEDRERHENMIGTLAFRLTDGGILNVTALYNRKGGYREGSLPLDCFESILGIPGLHIIGGDWNLNFFEKPSPKARALAKTLEYHGLHNLNIKNETTFHRLLNGIPQDTIIDYTWCSIELLSISSQAPLWSKCSDPEITATKMDHDAILTQFYGFTIGWTEQIKPTWAIVNEATFPGEMESALTGLMDKVSSGINGFTDYLVQGIQSTIRHHVPHLGTRHLKPSEFTTIETPEMTSIRQQRNAQHRLWVREKGIARQLLSFVNVTPDTVLIKRAIWQPANQAKEVLVALGQRLFNLKQHAFKVDWRETLYHTEQTIDRYAVWAARKPRPLPHLPDLWITVEDGPDPQVRHVSDDREKAWTFHKGWQPPPDHSSDRDRMLEDDEDNDDIPTQRIEMSQDVSPERLLRAVNRQHTRSSPGDDEITPRCIKLCIHVLLQYLVLLFTCCCYASCFPVAFKKARIIPITKTPGVNAHDLDNYRPISLLSSLGKLLESYLADLMADVTLHHNLLPKTQMAFRGRGTTAALLHATEIIRAGNRVNLVVSIFGMDATGAFNRVYRRKLLRILRKKRFPEWIVKMIDDWLSGREARIVLPGYISDFWSLDDGLPQGSPFSGLLYAFFACGLLEDPEDIDGECVIRIKEKDADGKEQVVGLLFKMAYMDDTYYIAVSESLARNVDILEAEYKKAQKWAAQFRQQFKPKKIHAFHLCPLADRIRGPHLRDRIPNFLPDNETDTFNMLGICLQVDKDGNLRWAKHSSNLQEKFKGLLAAFRRLVKSTHGYGPVEAAKYYLQRIRPALTYGAGAYIIPESQRQEWLNRDTPDDGPWGKDPKKKGTKKVRRLPDNERHTSLLETLKVMQNACLRVITGGLKTEPTTPMLEDTSIESIGVFLERTCLQQRANIFLTEVGTTIDNARNLVEEFGILVDSRRGRYRSCPLRDRWADNIRARRNDRKDSKLAIKAYRKFMSNPLATWSKETQQRAKRYVGKYCRKASLKSMQSLWKLYQRNTIRDLEAKGAQIPAFLNGSWGKNNRLLYNKMRPPLSTILFQLRTERIGLMAYLTSLKRPERREEGDELCRLCHGAAETVEHLFHYCPELNEQRGTLAKQINEDWINLLTDHGFLAAMFALMFFPIEAFAWSRENMVKSYFGKTKKKIPNRRS